MFYICDTMSQKKIYKIYKLIDPLTNEVRYIGITTRSLKQRLSQHCWDSKNGKITHKKNWINKLSISNHKPIIQLIENCFENEWEEKEKYWIKNYSNLTNTSKGGQGVIFKNKNTIKSITEQKSKAIIQLDLNCNFIKEWNSIKEAALYLKVGHSSVDNVLSKRSKSTQGFHFVYAKDYTENYFIKLHNNKPTVTKKFEIKVLFNDNTVIKFQTIKECAKYFKVSTSLISMILKNERTISNSFSNVKNILRYSLDSIEI